MTVSNRFPLLGFFVFTMFAFGMPLRGQTTQYCAFEIKVVRLSGAPAQGIPVAIIHDRREVLDTCTDSEGIASLCDSPLGFVDIVVGFDKCGAVTLNRLRAQWPSPVRATVLYEDAWCDHFAALPDRCQVLIRAKSSAGSAVAGARIERTNAGAALPASDALGRLFFSLKPGEAVEGFVAHSGFGRAAVSVRCTQDGPRDVEQAAVLH
jgi:hypothetical protein